MKGSTEIDPRAPRWLAINERLPAGWRVSDILALPQFGVTRIKAMHANGRDVADVPVCDIGEDIDARIVEALTDLIQRTEARP